MPVLLIVALIVAALAIFEFAALRWGHDSRDNFRFNRSTPVNRA